MVRRHLIGIVVLLALFIRNEGLSLPHQPAQDFEDISPFATVFESRTLPEDENGDFIARQMASVGNGHVTTTIYTDTVYMNGLYNGERGESHRARIPSGNNIRIKLDDGVTPETQSFALDVGKGVFTERFTLSGGSVSVEHRTFAHRYYTKIVVTQVQVTSTGNTPTTLSITNSPGSSSSDLNTPETGDFGSLLCARFMCADVLAKEDSRYQEKMPSVCTVSV